MAVGISTACFYPMETERSLIETGKLQADCVEIFINSPHELDKAYIDKFADIQKQYGVRVKSFHTYASFTESYYYFSSYERRFAESIEEFKRYFDGMHTLGAELLVMHGAKIPGSIPDEQVFEFVERFAKSIRHVHISDYTPTRDCVVPLCENAQFDFQRFFAAMRDKGYTGDYIIELYENGYESPAQIGEARNRLKKWL